MRRIHSLRGTLPPAALVLALALGSAPARADVLIIGGETRVELTAAGLLTSAGIAVGPLGTATIDASGTNPVAVFPITGGMLDSGTAELLIEHDGSGLSLSTSAFTVELRDFLIDTAQATIFSTVVLLPSGGSTTTLTDVALFDIGAGLELNLTSAGAGALTAAFGLPDLTGAQIGVATTNPVFVPEPSSWAILLIGLAGLGAASRRRRAAA